MRFLLYPRVKTTASAVVDKTVKASAQSSAKKAWGQQCSPNCGCVVRFEAAEQRNSSADSCHVTYTAKQVVSRPKGGSRQVVLTSKGRPMLQECSCSNLHQLASTMAEYYNERGADLRQMRSDLEFQSLRSSRAFQRDNSESKCTSSYIQ